MSGGVTGLGISSAAQRALTGDAGIQALLADGGGVKPEDASPGIGAFITFIVLAAIIILLAWSFTRHQRKIRARAALEEERRSAAREEAAKRYAEAGEPDAGGADQPEERGEPHGRDDAGERGDDPDGRGDDPDGQPRQPRTGGD